MKMYTTEELKAYAEASRDYLSELKDTGAAKEDLDSAKEEAKFWNREYARRLVKSEQK